VGIALVGVTVAGNGDFILIVDEGDGGGERQ
jgi:hypothetical protein